jgi:Bacterial dnaA protein helix-turn-helix
MGKTIPPGLSEQLVHLNLRGRRPHALVQDEEDWQALAAIAKRMLFWCGGYIHGCRCEGREIRFAVGVGHASIGAMARHISGAYAIHLRRRRGWTGSIFHRYIAVPVDADLFLDDLVFWLHRPPEPVNAEQPPGGLCWTADSAYLKPNSLSWVTTEPVLSALSPGGAGRSVYHRRKTQPLTPQVVAILTGRVVQGTRHPPIREHGSGASLHRDGSESLNIEKIARFVAQYSHVSYEDMRSASRRRAVSKAKIVAAVLCTRNGASVAAVGRLFGRSRSTLSERAECYRKTQPQLFAQAERALGAHLQEDRASIVERR